MSWGDVGESHGAAIAVLEVDLFESLGDDLAHVLVVHARGAGVRRGVVRRWGEVDGEAAEASWSVVPMGAA
jgi:hypothetical protein